MTRVFDVSDELVQYIYGEEQLKNFAHSQVTNNFQDMNDASLKERIEYFDEQSQRVFLTQAVQKVFNDEPITTDEGKAILEMALFDVVELDVH